MRMLSLLLMILGTLILQVEVRGIPKSRIPESRTIGLKFGITAEDYVLFKPNMQESHSICGWTKKDDTD